MASLAPTSSVSGFLQPGEQIRFTARKASAHLDHEGLLAQLGIGGSTGNAKHRHKPPPRKTGSLVVTDRRLLLVGHRGFFDRTPFLSLDISIDLAAARATLLERLQKNRGMDQAAQATLPWNRGKVYAQEWKRMDVLAAVHPQGWSGGQLGLGVHSLHLTAHENAAQGFVQHAMNMAGYGIAIVDTVAWVLGAKEVVGTDGNLVPADALRMFLQERAAAMARQEPELQAMIARGGAPPAPASAPPPPPPPPPLPPMGR